MFRLLGLLAGLAGVTDLGTGGHTDESLRRCVVAGRLARAAGYDDAVVRDVVVVALLEHIGCTAYSHEAGRMWGDDVAATRAALLTDPGTPTDAFRTFLPRLATATGRSKPAVAWSMARSMRSMSRDAPVATCEVAREAGRRLGLGALAQDSLAHMTATWNGNGFPSSRGDQIPLPARIMHVAGTAVMFWELGGAEASVEQVRRRSGGALDPELADLFIAAHAGLLDGLEADDPFRLALDTEPDPAEWVGDERRLGLARVLGDLVDLKSPSLHGHSSAVGELAGAAARSLGLDEANDVQAAGYLHDIGRVGVPSRIWDVPRPWTAAERDVARLHPYHTERVLARVPELASLAELAGAHHERCDGSGFHRGLRSDRLTMGARVLAAADEYRTLMEDRPHRPGVTAGEARRRLEAEVRSGRLDVDAVAAVLAASGGAGRRRVSAGGLTARQLEVLRLVAKGLSNKEIAGRLVLSPRTVDRHVADVYTRIGVTSRAAAALFTIEHGLAGPIEADHEAKPG